MIPSFEAIDKMIDFYISRDKDFSNYNPINKYRDIFIFCDQYDLDIWQSFFESTKVCNGIFDPLVEGCINTMQYGGYNINLKLL